MVEKLLICSDIHDDVEALETFVDYAQAQCADRILILGDMGLRPYTSNDLEQLVRGRDEQRFIQAKRDHSRQVLGEMKQIIDQSGIPLVMVPGNYDGTQDSEAVFGESNLHKKTMSFGNASVVGYGGADASPGHIELLQRLGEIEYFDHQELYSLLTNKKSDICMIHNPPRGFCDDMFNGQNVGTPATTQHIIDYSPKLVLSGHIHEAGPNGNNPSGVKGVKVYQNPKTGEDTLILNPGNLGRFELLDPRTLEPIRQFDYGTFMEVNIDENGNPQSVSSYNLDTKTGTIGNVKKLEEYTF
ncbi:hypothetical protein HN943_02475 [archaeon]|jgi:Icc-related predicted phosphoesterase|nr:hypothetical protein [archaeon]MBT7297735.1 hypothetical protein [archaeon]